MSPEEPRGPVGGRESSQPARQGRHLGYADAAHRDAPHGELTREVLGRRGYGGFANTGEFPALPVTLELPAIVAGSEPRRDRWPGKRSGNSAYRTAWALIANTGGTTALGFVYWVVVAHLYDPRTIGRASALVSALLLLSMLTQLNLSSALPRFLPGAGRSSGRRLIGYSYGVSSLAALPVAAGFVLLMPRLSGQWRFLSGSRLLEILFVVAAVVWGVFALEDAALTGLRRAEVVPVENLVYGVMKLVLVICIAKLLPTAGIFASWTVPLLVIIPVVNILIFRRYIKPGRDSGAPIRVGQVARFTSLDYLASLSAQSYGTLLPLLVLSLLGPAANGSFYIAWTISTGLTLVATNFGMSLMVEAAASPDRLAELTKGIIARCALVTILGATILGAAARPILHIYGATYAAHAVPLLVMLALGSIPRAAVIITWSLDRVANRVGRAALTQAILALLVLAGSRYLLKYFGIDGVGYAWTAANFAIAIVRLPTLIKGMRPSPAVTPAAAMRAGSPQAPGIVAHPGVSRQGAQRGRHRAAGPGVSRHGGQRGRHRTAGPAPSAGAAAPEAGPGSYR